MLTRLFSRKDRPPRLHRLLLEDRPDRIPDVATDERVRTLDKFERNAIHVAVSLDRHDCSTSR
jgi:hypothetical protein